VWELREIQKQLDGVNGAIAEGIRRTVNWYLSSCKDGDIQTLERRLMEWA
jgi:hypothetical protein